MSSSNNAKPHNSLIANIVVAFCKIWNFKWGLKGGGTMVRLTKRLFPNISRYHLNYPGFGRCNISFLDFNWLRQACCGPIEEKSLLNQIQSYSSDLRVVWDIGANSGFLAVELILQLNPEKLVLFEPNPEHTVALQSISDMDSRIQIIMAGLSDCRGTAKLHIPGEINSGSSCASLNEKIAGTGNHVHQVTVTLETGDFFVDSGTVPPPNLIVIDVEGHEKSVIKGLSKTIECFQPIIVMEHLFLPDETMRNMIPQGYEIQTICDQTGLLIPGMNKKRGHNLLLIPNGIVKDN